MSVVACHRESPRSNGPRPTCNNQHQRTLGAGLPYHPCTLPPTLVPGRSGSAKPVRHRPQLCFPLFLLRSPAIMLKPPPFRPRAVPLSLHYIRMLGSLPTTATSTTATSPMNDNYIHFGTCLWRPTETMWSVPCAENSWVGAPMLLLHSASPIFLIPCGRSSIPSLETIVRPGRGRGLAESIHQRAHPTPPRVARGGRVGRAI